MKTMPLGFGVASLALLLANAPCARAASPAEAASLRLDPRLATAMRTAPEDTVSVWVRFADKGERDAADLRARLRIADASLTARARARRLRAGVRPIVDALDLPVDPGHLDALRARGFSPFAVSRWFNRAAVRIPAARLTELTVLPMVARISPVERVRRSGGVEATPSPASGPGGDASLRDESGQSGHAIAYGRSLAQLEQIGVPALHDSGYTGRGVLICMLDSGYRYQRRHEATRDIDVPPGMTRDFAEGDTVVNDDFAAVHGLWTLACAGANKAGQLVGSAPGASYALARTEVENSETVVEMLYWAQGAEWADSLGADVISSSLGYNEFPESMFSYTFEDMDGHTTTVTRAAEIAAAKGILVVNSVGNLEGDPDGWRRISAPADMHGDSLVSVGAINLNGRLGFFSAGGPTADGRIKPDLVACGVANPLPSADDTTGGYFENSGTSLAAPIVAGLAACVLQARPAWSAREVIQALYDSADRSGNPINGYGHGIPNGAAILGAAPLPPLRFRNLLGLAVDAPNPVAHGRFPVTVRFELAATATAAAPARLDVLDLSGRVVRRLWAGALVPGQTVSLSWDGASDGGSRSAGIHWILLRAGGMRNALRVVSL